MHSKFKEALSFHKIGNLKKANDICLEIGADKLIYQDLDDLISAVKEGNGAIKHFDTSCFNGEYLTNGVSPEYLRKLGTMREND